MDQEADKWAEIWQEGQQRDEPSWGKDCSFDTELTVTALREAAKSFSPDTGVGTDNISPRALSRLSDEALMALVHLFERLEELGDWSDALNLVLIVLLPKADGGLRPIGLLPTLIRVWSRARMTDDQSVGGTEFAPSVVWWSWPSEQKRVNMHRPCWT